MKPYREKAAGLARYRVERQADEQWPSDVAALLGKRRKPVGRMKGVALDEVLDRELVHAARGK